MKNRNLNIAYATEVLNGRLNGSSADVEYTETNKNVTFVKKINGRGTVSAPCQKYNIKKFMNIVDDFEINEKTMINKDGSKKSRIDIEPNAFKYAADDIFGYMMAVKKIVLSEDEYNELSDDEKLNYTKKDGKKQIKYEKIGTGTLKRRSNFMMSHLTNVSNKIINREWCLSTTDGGSNLPITIETTSGIFSGIANINIRDIGKYNVSDSELEFRDFGVEQAKALNVSDLDKDEKFKRIKSALRGLEYLSIQGNQNNYLTDTKPKFVILGEYGWGNNVFQGVFKKDGVDINLLKETIEENEEFRLSNIWIGVNKFADDKYNNLKQQLENDLKEYDFIKTTNVKDAFNSYFEYLKETL